MSDNEYNSDDNLIGDPNDLEEIIEEQAEEIGDDQPDAENQESAENQNDEQQATPVVPKKRVVKNPQPKLDPVRLCGPRGIATLEDVFQDFKFYGKGHEKTDLNRVLKRLGHWAHRLYPRFQFDDTLEKIEKLGAKRPVQTNISKIRMGMNTIDEQFVRDAEDDVVDNVEVGGESNTRVAEDMFDELLNQQEEHNRIPDPHPVDNVVSQTYAPLSLSEEQRARMLRNRQLAEERRLARLKAQHEEKINSAQGRDDEQGPSGETSLGEGGDGQTLSSTERAEESREKSSTEEPRTVPRDVNSDAEIRPKEAEHGLVSSGGDEINTSQAGMSKNFSEILHSSVDERTSAELQLMKDECISSQLNDNLDSSTRDKTHDNKSVEDVTSNVASVALAGSELKETSVHEKGSVLTLRESEGHGVENNVPGTDSNKAGPDIFFNDASSEDEDRLMIVDQ